MSTCMLLPSSSVMASYLWRSYAASLAGGGLGLKVFVANRMENMPLLPVPP